MIGGDDDGLWYPSVENIIDIHDDIVSEYPDTEAGIRNRGAIDFALDHISRVGTDDDVIHEKAFHLLRLLTANHPFVDGNKRTALDTVSTFYFFNGYEFDYDNEIRSILKSFGTEERSVDQQRVKRYLEEHTAPLDVENEVDRWRDELIEMGLERLDEFLNADE